MDPGSAAHSSTLRRARDDKAGADLSKFFEEVLEEGKKKSYPEDFEAFWKSYPVDPLMSKKTAGEVWRRRSAADRAAARDRADRLLKRGKYAERFS